MISDDVDALILIAQRAEAAAKADNKTWWAGQQDRLRERRQVK